MYPFNPASAEAMQRSCDEAKLTAKTIARARIGGMEVSQCYHSSSWVMMTREQFESILDTLDQAFPPSEGDCSHEWNDDLYCSKCGADGRA
jgi:hypothetical protein